jgi:hypothetical protein
MQARLKYDLDPKHPFEAARHDGARRSGCGARSRPGILTDGCFIRNRVQAEGTPSVDLVYQWGYVKYH